MGVSTDAIIAFGFDLGEELPESLEQLLSDADGEIDEALATDMGLTLPDYNVVGYEEFSAARDAAVAKVKFELIQHCSADFTMYFLAVRGSSKRAKRGYPVALDADSLKTDLFPCNGSIDAMNVFCQRHGIEWKDPQWHIFSMWH